MVEISTILKPNRFKIILSTLIFIPILAIMIMLFELIYPGDLTSFIFFDFFEYLNTIIIPILLSLMVSYLLGSLVDHYIASKTLKLTIAIISGIISLLILYIFYKMITEPVICDPVHKPSQGANYHTKIFDDIPVNKKTVQESFQQCIGRLNK